MVIVIAPEKDIEDEIAILTQLFEAGLEYYHLRKPTKDREMLRGYLNQIDSIYHNRIVVHSYHELVNEFNLKGIHFQEQERKDKLEIPGRYFKNLEMYGKTISSSFHEPEAVLHCDFEFDYHLLSPVFTSLSKSGYEGRGFDVNTIDKTIIGMGGVIADNCMAFKTLGYKGVGVLGGVWNSMNPVEDFEKIKSNFESA
ncbi:thiamine phosphate synthase [Gelidibacter sp. F2691]|nr:thiamine phosphate synthase [Gelidibacter sp. F2691]